MFAEVVGEVVGDIIVLIEDRTLGWEWNVVAVIVTA